MGPRAEGVRVLPQKGRKHVQPPTPGDSPKESTVGDATEFTYLQGGWEQRPHLAALLRVAWRRAWSAADMAPHQQGEAYIRRETKLARHTISRERRESPEDFSTFRT